MMNKTTIAILLMGLAVAGCNRSTSALNVNTQTPPQPLPSVPSGNVQSSQLDPIATQNGGGQPGLAQPLPEVPATAPQPELPQAAEVASATPEVSSDATQIASAQAPAASAEPLTHEPLAGSWNVPSDNADCRIILAFTKWSGGYRAATRRCSSSEIGSINAWDIQGNQVVLVDSTGNKVANLQSTGSNRYSGQTVSGKPISFAR